MKTIETTTNTRLHNLILRLHAFHKTRHGIDMGEDEYKFHESKWNTKEKELEEMISYMENYL